MVSDDRDGVGVELHTKLLIIGLRRPPEGNAPLLVEVVVLQTADAWADMDKAVNDPVDAIQMFFHQMILSVHIGTP